MSGIKEATVDDQKRHTFFNFIFPVPGVACIARQHIDDGKFVNDFFTMPDDLDRMIAHIARFIANHHLWYCAQLFKSDDRKKENVLCCPTAWADLDSCHPRRMILPPSVVLESSPDRYQALWRFDKPVAPEIGERISKQIAYTHADDGCDKSGWDLTQLLRIPFTPNLKYHPPPNVRIITTNPTLYTPADFDIYPAVPEGFMNGKYPFPDEIPDAEMTISDHRNDFNPMVITLMAVEPKEDWSKEMWKLELLLFEAGLQRDEVYAVMQNARCNKFKRDNRGQEALWKDVCKAYEFTKEIAPEVIVEGVSYTELLTPEERKWVEDTPTVVDDYIAYGKESSDALPQFHQAGIFVILSALLSSYITLPMTHGIMPLNMWFLVLAQTAQPYSSLVLTPNGWRNMGDLQVGDFVIGENGQSTLIEAIYEQGKVEAYEVTFMDGAKVECSKDHLWKCRPDASRHEQVLPLSNLKTRLDNREDKTWISRPRVPIMTGPVNFEQSTELPVDPYILGVWLAEGCRSYYNVEIANQEEELVNLVRERLPEGLRLHNYGHNCIWFIQEQSARKGGQAKRFNPVRDGFKELGILNLYGFERYVPPQYKYAPTKFRLEVLQGLMDGDGTISPTGHCRYKTTSEQLAKDVIDLVRSLGGRATYTQCTTVPGTHDSWQVNFTPNEQLIPFKLPRKLAELGQATISKRWGWRGIKSIQPVGMKPMRCIAVAAKDGLYITNDYIVTHNTVSRKSTTMEMAMSVLHDIFPEAMMATDGSLEGMFHALSTRPGQASVFKRDEVSGLFEAMAKKDYLAGMAETLTALYDGSTQKRVLRRESYEVYKPRLIFYGAGIKTKIEEILNTRHIDSGFLPRFVFISGEVNPDNLRPEGPPTGASTATRDAIVERLRLIMEHYKGVQKISVNGHVSTLKKEWAAEMTPEAWDYYNFCVETMRGDAHRNINYRSIIAPVYERLSRSGLKAGVLIAATRLEDKIMVTKQDLLQAFYFVEQWRVHAYKIVTNLNKSQFEGVLDKASLMIMKTPGIGRAEIMRAFKLKSREADELILTLLQRGLARAEGTKGKEHLFPLWMEAE